MSAYGFESELDNVVVNFHKDQIVGVMTQIQEAQASKMALTELLRPYIERFFTNLVANATDRELKLRYSQFMKYGKFDIIDEEVLRFHAMSRSMPVTHDVSVQELLNS